MTKLVRQLKRKDAANWPEIVRLAMSTLYKESDKDLKFTIEVDKGTRSLKINKLCRKWHGELAKKVYDSTGEVYDSDEIHEWVVKKLLPKRTVELNGDMVIKRAETRKLSNKAFAEFLTKYEIYAAEKFQVIFTQPADLYFDALMIQAEPEKVTDGM